MALQAWLLMGFSVRIKPILVLPSKVPVMIREIETEDISELAKLFVEVFNAPPWNDRWDAHTAKTRLREIFGTPGFYGIVEFGAMRSSGSNGLPRTAQREPELLPQGDVR